ncbi:Chromo domain/shadow [Macleaya cordata]|uniref:Chromo domain/shadow n=1 Tax=Macleaya cordata TaxID=56857 RepID=A0A200QZ87_MACCD|nr:Chromo domain/shadow [Macleaya cordata]
MTGRGGGGSGGWRRKREEQNNHRGGGGGESEEDVVRLGMEAEEEEENDGEEEMEYGEEEEGEEMEMENEDEGQQEEEDVGEEERERKDQSVPPKLDEGFYEIEDVRRKRVRKGQVQYLIKWRGWPETANTWEPLENLQSCSEVIDAFEESLIASKNKLSRGSRKRKRKSGAIHTQTKKKQQRSTSNLSGSKVGRSSGALSSASVDNSSPLSAPPPDRVHTSKSVNSKDHGNNEEAKNENGNNVERITQQTENGSSNICLRNEQNKEEIVFEVDPKLSELKGITSTDNLNSGNGKVSINFSDTRNSDKDGLTDGLPISEFGEPVPSNRFTGAKKRKSGCVRRFKQESASLEQDEGQNGIPRRTMEFGDKFEMVRVEDGEVPLGDDARDKNKLHDSMNPPSITKIIKPIGYSASISNNVQDVCVTFVAMRSDGKEVVVDNKFLKANNPHLVSTSNISAIPLLHEMTTFTRCLYCQHGGDVQETNVHKLIFTCCRSAHPR